MLKTVQIEEDVYEFLRLSGDLETASMVLRRLLHLPPPPAPTVGVTPVPNDRTDPEARPSTPNSSPEQQSALERLAADPSFNRVIATKRYLTRRYLRVLSVAFNEKPERIPSVLEEVCGRGRKYFARSREEIEASGTSTQPRLIPDTAYWAMTNADTPQKKVMLDKVLGILGYSDEEIEAVTAAMKIS